MSQLDSLFDLHTSLKELVRQGTIGRTGGPYELNLRDLSKFRDVFRGSIDSQLFHYQYMNTTDEEDEATEGEEQPSTGLTRTMGASDSRFLSIRKFAQVAYACQFHGHDDFVKACEEINSKFPINSTLSKRENEASIDASVATVVRIGSIYINTGNEEPNSSSVSLVHTEKTVRQLELLAAACQSKRAVLLEGDICSRKSSLVIELARLTRQHLVIIPMHENFETSDLIGSWRPTASSTQRHPLFNKVETMFKQVIKVLFLIVLPLQSKDENNDVFSKFKGILRKRLPIAGADQYEMVPYEIEALNELVTLLNQLIKISQLGNEGKVLISCYGRQADYYATKLKSVRRDNQQEMSFAFVESEFVQAIREGWWVLLDNINSAPPEVLERLNSLTEDNPMLSLYENSHGQVLTQRNGIHANFRLFTTANLNRIYSNKLSSAFLNRVIRIWLPPIDECQLDSDSKITQSDLHELLVAQLSSIAAGKQLAHLLVRIHVDVKQQVKDGKLTYPSDFLITYRLLEQCVQTLGYLVNKGINPVDACFWALLRSYCSSLRNIGEYRFFIEHLQQTIDRLKLRSMSTIYSTPANRVDTKQPLYLQEAQGLRAHFVQFERFLIELQFTVLQLLAGDATSGKATRDLFILFVDEILLPLTPTDGQLIQSKQVLLNHEDDSQLDLQPMLAELSKTRQIATRFDRTSSLDLSTFVQDFLQTGSRSFQILCDQLSNALNTFIRNTSFSDTAERLAFLQRAVSIVDTFQRFFSSSLFATFDQRTNLTLLCAQLTQHLRPLLTFKEKCKAFELFQDAAFVEAKNEFRLHLFNHFDTGLIWSFERAQTFPIRSARKDLRKLIQHVVSQQTAQNVLRPLEHFATLQEWIGLQWTFEDYLTSTVRDALQKNISITLDFVLECEVKFCAWELCKQFSILIDEIVHNLPPESSSINSECLDLKRDVDEINNQVKQHEESIQQIKDQLAARSESNPTETTNDENTPGRLQRNHSVFNPDDDDLTVRLSSLNDEVNRSRERLSIARDRYMRKEETRSNMLKQASNALIRLQNETQTALASVTYRFVRQRFEQSDARQLHDLSQSLKEARQNPTLTNIDGVLDFRAVLATPFGRALIEHDDVVQSPLIFILCNFFVAPRLYDHRRLHFISDWKPFTTDFDIRTLNSADLFFYCPSKRPRECSLLTVKNSVRQVSFVLWSLEQFIDTGDLEKTLRDSLPSSVELNIEHQRLPEVARTLTNDGYTTFGLACLIHLHEASGSSTPTTNELHKQLLFIVEQVKQFVQHKASEGGKSLPMLIYQQASRFGSELQGLNLKDSSSDPWMIAVEQVWKLIKPYRGIFSSTKTQNIDQDLRYTIQSVRPANLSSRITSLAFVKSLTTQYNCTHLIIDHLTDGGMLTDAEDVKDFELFFEFISRINRLLKLIARHVLFCGEQVAEQFYRCTPTLISHLESVFRSTVSVTDLAKENLHILVKQSPSALKEFQSQLDQVFISLRVPDTLLSRYSLGDIITHVSPLYDENRESSLVNRSPSPDDSFGSFPTSIDPREIRRRTMRSKIDETIVKVTALLSRANQLSIRPHLIIQRIHSTLHRLKTFDISQESENSYNALLNEEQLIEDLLHKFSREINQYTAFHLVLPSDQPIHQLTDKEVQLDSTSTTASNHENECKALSKRFHQMSQGKESTALNQIIRLTHAQVSDQTWIEAMSLLVPDKRNELKTILMSLNDELAMQIDNTPDEDLLISQIVSTYAQFRYDLLDEETKRDMLSNYVPVAHLSRELREWMTKTDLNVFNMLETIQKLKNDLSLAQNQMKNFTGKASCYLLPVDLRPEDLICLFAPEQTSTIQTIFAKYQEFDTYLACRCDDVQPMQLPKISTSDAAKHGLSTFAYRHDSNLVSLFDKEKHIHSTVDITSKFIQQLIDVCIDPKTREGMLMSTCTNVRELFPVQMALSMALLVLIDSVGGQLHDFKHQTRRLMMTTLKTSEDEIKQMQMKLQKLGQELRETEKKAKRIAENLSDARNDLHGATNESYMLLEKMQKSVSEWIKTDADIKKNLDDQGKRIDHAEKDLQLSTERYQMRLEQEQENWLNTLFEYFQKISRHIRLFMGQFSATPTSSECTVNDLLTIIVNVTRRQLLDTSILLLEHSQTKKLEKKTNDILAEIQEHLMKLSDSDQMRAFVVFYCHIMRMAFSSLLNCLTSWKEYATTLQTSQMKFYAETGKKKNLAKLNTWTSEQCDRFLQEIRKGAEQTKVVDLAQQIKQRVRRDVVSLETSLTGHNAQQMQHLIREFERFVINLLIVGCRFVQLQRGINEPLDELLSDVSIDDLDLHVSRSELELLQLLEARETQLHSQSSTLLFLTLHLAFDFNSNPFGLFDQLDQSIQALTRLLVPSAYMVKRTWSTIDELIEKTAKSITTDEFNLAQKIADVFQSLADPSNPIANYTHFLISLFEGGALSSASDQIDRLCETFLHHRSGLKLFCEQLVLRWHTTLKEIFRAFIQSQKYYIHRQLEWNQRKMKKFDEALTNDSNRGGQIFLADIERMLKIKNIVLATADSQRKATLLKQFYHLEIIYQLTLGGIDNLEIILMNKPIEQMDFVLIRQLFISAKNLYTTSEEILLKESFHDFVRGERAVTQAFQVIEDLYRQESKIFGNFYQLCKRQTIDRYEQLTRASDFREFLEQSRAANEQWQQAGEKFVTFRSDERRAGRGWLRTIGRGVLGAVRSAGLFLTSQSDAAPLDKAVDTTLHQILLYMQSHQSGNEQIFTVAPQEELSKLIQLHKNYKASLSLKDLDGHQFSKTDAIYRFEIEQYDLHLTGIIICFWRAAEDRPFHLLSVPLTKRTTRLNVIIKTPVIALSVDTEYFAVKRKKLSSLIKERKSYSVKNSFELRCENIHGKLCYTVDRYQDALTPSIIPSLFDIQQKLDDLDNHLHLRLTDRREADLFHQSPTTVSFARLTSAIHQISEMIRCAAMQSGALSNTSTIYTQFKRLSDSNVHNRAIDLLRNATFSNVPSTMQLVEDTNAAIEKKFDQVWTRSMHDAFQLSRKCLNEANTRLVLCHNHVRQTKAQFILAYAWANALSLHPSSNTEQEFSAMLTDYQQMTKLSNEESIRCENDCRRILVDAHRIYRTIKRTSHNWTDIERLLSFTSFPSEPNLTEAFSRSQMSRDAHLWITETTDTDGSSNFQCHPQPAVLDFGITLSTIPQRLTQRIFLHNQSDRDLTVQLAQPTNAHKLFDVSGETIQVASGDTHELPVLLKSPTTIGSIDENWHLKIDEQFTLGDVLRVQVQTVEVDVKLSAETIDFGLIPCESHRLERNVQLKNVLPCAMRIKAQLQTPETNPWQSNLNILSTEIELAAESSVPFSVTMETSENGEEDVEADICLAINTPKNIKWLKILGQVRRTRMLISHQNRLIMDNVNSGRLSFNDFYKAEKRRLSFEFRNDGQVEYALRLQSSALKLFVENAEMGAKETKIIEVEVDMANETRRDFVLDIEFLNCKRRCQLTLVCETSYAQVTYSTRPDDHKQIVTIAQSAHMEQIWNPNQSSLKPIEHEITFKNTGQAAGIVRFDQIITRNNAAKLSTERFRVEPADFVVCPQSSLPVRFIYEPIDFQTFDVDVQLTSNNSNSTISIPFYVKFDKPVLKSTPCAVVDLGEIKTGQLFKDNALALHNIGQKELRFCVSQTRTKQVFVRSAALQGSATQARAIAISQPIRINPTMTQTLSVEIDMDVLNSQFDSEIIELAQFELTSLCDPVIDTEGKLVNRSILITIIGHTRPMPTFTLPGNSATDTWSAFRLLPADWLFQIYRQHTILSSYAPLVALTAIAHTCGSDKTNSSLPTEKEQWKKFCTDLSVRNRLTLDDFSDATKAQEATESLAKELRSTFRGGHRSFFHHCHLFYRSFTAIDSIRLQLLAVINAAENIDEAYAMQSFVKKFWDTYEKCPLDQAYQGAVDLVHRCVSQDRVMPQAVRTFSTWIYRAIHSSVPEDTAKKLCSMISPTGTLSELLSASTTLFDLKWTLLCGLLHADVKRILNKLIHKDHTALLDLHRIYADLHQPGSTQHSLLDAAHRGHRSWNKSDSKRKSDLLTPLLIDWTELVTIINSISDKKQTVLADLLSMASVILLRLGAPPEFLRQLREIFQLSFSYDITRKLHELLRVPYSSARPLADRIYGFRQPLVGYHTAKPIERSDLKSFCTILEQLVLLTPNLWKVARRAIEIIGDLLCDAGSATVNVSTIVAEVVRFLCVVHPEKNWPLIQQSFTQLGSTPTWQTTADFVKNIGCHEETVRLAETVAEITDSETTLKTLFELGRRISTTDELAIVNAHETSIRSLQSTATSSIELLELIEPFVLPEIKQKIHAFLVLSRLSSVEPLTDEERYIQFDNIVPSWLTLIDITSPQLERIFAALSSILTSFVGLFTTRGVPLCQHLYTTSLATALCTLAHCRRSVRDESHVTSSSAPPDHSPSIVNAVIQALAQRVPSQTQVRPTPVLPTLSTPATVATTLPTTSAICPYSEETLMKMEQSVAVYLHGNARQSFRFTESDTIREIVTVALAYRPQVAQWYAMFATFNVLMHHRPNAADAEQVKVGYNIVQRGLQLLRDIIVARKILEPTFAYTGVRFLLKDLNQLEKCLLSLALDKYPQLLKTLRQLNVDITQRKQDFKAPSRSIAPTSSTPRRSRLELIQELAAPPEFTERYETTQPAVNEHSDVPLTMDDWQEAMQASNNQQFDDMLKLAKKSQKKKKQKMNGNSTVSIQANVQTLAANMLAQNTNKAKAMPITSDGSDGLDQPTSDLSSGDHSVDIDLQMKAMQQHLQKQPNLVEMYEKIHNKVASAVPSGKLDNRAALKSMVRPSQWTYQLLIESGPIARMIDTIVKEFRTNWEKLTSSIHLSDQHQIRWCIMVDNSGSMSLHRTIIYETLVVIMELLRKLETKFAVARFGTKKNQKILKNLHDLFTNEDGQFVLEALTFDEGTYPATGLARVGDQVFPAGADAHCPPNTTVHRLVLMITDGLTEERDNASYSRTITKNNIKLGFMFIESAEQSSSQLLLRGLQQAQHCVVKANNISELPLKVPQLMYEMIQARLTSAAVPASAIAISPTVSIKMPRTVSQVTEEKPKYTAENPTSYTISSPTATIPRLTEVGSKLTSYLFRSGEYTDFASHAVDKLRQHYQQLEVTSTMQEMEKNWFADEYRFNNVIDDLSTAFGDVVFPLNKFTRRRAALRGSSLYLPGLIKAMTTEWSYKKIFSAKLAGGKRDHAVCLVLDVSTSMFGTLSSGLIDGLIVLIGALRKLNLDNCGVIVFGKDVRLIKTNEQSWDAASISTLMNELRFNEDDDTKDADALEAAIDLLSHSSVRGEKKIFILTDGYTNCSSHLTMVQQRAEDNGIDLVAIAIGTGQTNLKSAYKRYLQCTTPYGLPKAIRSLFEQETQLFPFDPTSKRDANDLPNPGSPEGLFSDIESKKVFNEMIKELRGEREAKLVNSGQTASNIIVNICFCLDCTGSMSRWLAAAKEQMRSIIEGITMLIKKEYPSLNLKLYFAVVGYRDINDQPQFQTQNFTDNITEVITFLQRLTAQGGDDIPEDVLGALDQCLKLNWSPTNARFIVLITDAPGHGPELNNNLTIDKHPQGNGKHTVQAICDRLLADGSEVDLMFCRIKPNATAHMEQAFRTRYDTRKDETGKAFTTIQLFDEKQQETASFHFVFVLDESGSMAGEWNSLKQAYREFLTRRNNDQGGDDHFTVVLFDSGARTITQQQRLANTPKDLPPLNCGGTIYSAGLTQASAAIAADRTASSVVMIFMSDGGNGGGQDPLAMIRQFKQSYGSNHNFICHTVGFGAGVASGSAAWTLLANMASAGGGQAYSAQTGAQLGTVFGTIAANSTTSSALVDRFSAILAREISVKIMVDYL